MGSLDVVGALQANTKAEDHLTRVVIPCYDTKFKKENKFECVHWGFVKLGKFDFSFNVKKQLINWVWLSH
jgi:starch synthase